jgi:hypothetical protein
MCTHTSYTFPCEHVATDIKYCSSAPAPPKKDSKKKLAMCKKPAFVDKEVYPTTASGKAPKCPLPRCPYEMRGGCWNCCWCGKSGNLRGRCSCVMITEGTEYRCEHICCGTCEYGTRE